MQPHLELDERDRDILFKRVQERDEIEGPKVGDFVRFPDGRLERFTYDWDDAIQTTMKGFGEGSFYLHENGGSSYSGGLDPAIPKECLTKLPEIKDGRFWFFHHNYATAHNGVDVMVPCRVYGYIPKEESLHEKHECEILPFLRTGRVAQGIHQARRQGSLLRDRVGRETGEGKAGR